MPVLVIDDEEMILRMAARILEGAGYNVLISDGWEAAQLRLQELSGEIQAIILDYNLRDVSGVELLEAVRAEAPEVPIVISSGDMIDLNLLPPRLRSGMSVLQKPYPSASLIYVVQKAIEETTESF